MGVSIPRSIRRTAPAICLALALWPAASPSEQRVQSESVVGVSVPVQVTRDGQPVRGLTVANFVLLDDGKPQEIKALDVVDLSALATADPAGSFGNPPAALRHFLFLFDLSFSEPVAILRARSAVQELITQSLHPTDLVAVGVYSVTQGFRLVLGFTPDREQARAAIESLGATDPARRSADPLQFSYFEPTTGKANIGFEAGGDDRSDMLEAHLRDLQGGVGPMKRTDQRAQVNRFSRDLGAVARLLNAIEGRKYVVLLSEGFDSSLVFASGNQEEQKQISEASEMGEVWKIDTTQRFGSTNAQSTLDTMLSEFRRADAVIQTVEIRPTQGSLTEDGSREAGTGTDVLFVMANETGGELYQQSNDLADTMGEMLKRTGVSYQLFFQPKNPKIDGEFHKLKVKLKGVPRGTKATHRPGYYAPRAFADRSATEHRLEAAALIAAGGNRGDLSGAVLAAPFRIDAPNAYVPFLVEVDGEGLLQGQTGHTLEVEIFAYALDHNGTIRDYAAQTLGLELASVRDRLRTNGLKFGGDLEIGTGSYSIRVLVRNRETGAFYVRTSQLEVPEFTSSEPLVLQPFVPEPRGKWLLVRANPADDAAPPPFPFMIGEEPFLPAARPVAHVNVELRLCLVVYGFADRPITLRGSAVGADGQAVEQVELILDDRLPAATPSAELLQVRYVPQDLASGAYRLVVSVVDASTGGSASGATPLLVE